MNGLYASKCKGMNDKQKDLGKNGSMETLQTALRQLQNIAQRDVT